MRFIYWPLAAPIILLLAISILALSSIPGNYVIYQSAWIALGLGFFIAFHYIDWRPFTQYRWFVILVYAAIVLLVSATLVFAPRIHGNRAWLVMGPVRLQASEFVKIGLILVLAYFLRTRHAAIARWSTILYSFLIVAVPMGIVAIEPDLGSAIVIGALWFCLLVFSGLKMRHIAIAAMVFALIGSFAWSYILADYQKNRIIGFLNPEGDPLGMNYNVIQSKIAIGSAGFWGKGYHQGTQVQLGFLPEAKTDFIFPAFIEEWGIAGGLVVIFAFLYLVFTILRIGIVTESNFEKFICLGAAAILSLHFMINVGSAVGFFPVVGIPFPLVSYGGSNLSVNLFLLSLVHSIRLRLS